MCAKVVIMNIFRYFFGILYRTIFSVKNNLFIENISPKSLLIKMETIFVDKSLEGGDKNVKYTFKNWILYQQYTCA